MIWEAIALIMCDTKPTGENKNLWTGTLIIMVQETTNQLFGARMLLDPI